MRNNVTQGKWFVGLLLVVALVGAVFVLNQRSEIRPDHTYEVGVFQVVRHPALDSMTKAFCDDLSARYAGKIQFDTKIPEGDAGKTEQMAQAFATGRYDLVFVVGTNLAQSLAKKTTTIPIVLGAATDPQSAGLVDTWDKPGRNVTGTSDLSPIGAQLDRLKELMPQVKQVGIIYNASEDNSRIIFERFKTACAQRNLNLIPKTISSPNEVEQTVVALSGKVDALYAPTDATVQTAFPMLIKAANEVRIPVFSCDQGTVQKGAIFSVGFDYADLGHTAAEMAMEILDGKAKPESMPIRLVGKSSLYYSETQLKSYGLSVPESWTKDGKRVDE
jgi:putative ABC transport system substrate-binding protein